MVTLISELESGPGGNPVRSKCNLLVIDLGSASGDGLIPFSSNFESMKLSIGFLTHFLFFTSGISGRSIFCNDHQSLLALSSAPLRKFRLGVSTVIKNIIIE